MAYAIHYPGLDKLAYRDELEKYVNIPIVVDSSIAVITVATEDLLESAYNIRQLNNSKVPFINADLFNNDKTEFWSMKRKLKDYVEALKTVESPYVLLMDANDAVVTRNLDESFLDAFLGFGADIVYNASPTRFPKNEYFEKEGPFCTRFLNAGLCFGKTDKMLEFYREALIASGDNQSESEQHYIKTVWQRFENVVIDENRELFICHNREFRDVESGMNLKTEKGYPVRVFYSRDTDYYGPLFEYYSKRMIDIDENITPVLLGSEGHLKDQLEKSGCKYISIKDNTTFSVILEALQEVDTIYAMIIDPEHSVIVGDLNKEMLDMFNDEGYPVVYGCLTSRDDVTDTERKKADDHYINKFMNPATIFGITENLRALMAEAAEEHDNASYPVLRDLWLHGNDTGTDGKQVIFTACYFNDIEIIDGKCQMISPDLRKKEDGWHLV